MQKYKVKMNSQSLFRFILNKIYNELNFKWLFLKIFLRGKRMENGIKRKSRGNSGFPFYSILQSPTY